MLRFRNLDVTPSDPVCRWGVEGLLTAIDRGTIVDWARIAEALQSDPDGSLAAEVLIACSLAEDVGAAAALHTLVGQASDPHRRRS